MQQQLNEITQSALAELAQITAVADMPSLRVRVFGKNGSLTALLRGMGGLSAEERPLWGQKVNAARQQLEQAFAKREQELFTAEESARLAAEAVDVTLPAKPARTGGLHPLTLVTNELLSTFTSMGFNVAVGPEVETDYYNFQALNIPADHPARDMQDTFYITESILLRTQTSAAQIHTMEQLTPPIKVVCPGRVFRCDEVDATHSPVFHQMEGLYVDKGVTLCDLKGLLDEFARELYGQGTKTKFRPSFFPFTEPSVEVDVTCSECGGKGCRMCKGTGWVEILGAGMVNPNVLRNCHIDPDVYSGFAFGLGLDRIAVTRYHISDMRLLFENDLRFLEQFGGRV